MDFYLPLTILGTSFNAIALSFTSCFLNCFKETDQRGMGETAKRRRGREEEKGSGSEKERGDRCGLVALQSQMYLLLEF